MHNDVFVCFFYIPVLLFPMSLGVTVQRIVFEGS